MKIKKKIGKFGRKFGGRPYQMVRNISYGFAEMIHQLKEVRHMATGCYVTGSSNDIFCKGNYKPDLASEVKNNEIRHGIICLCDGKFHHGGPTDRLRGILSTYEEAKKRGLPFYIHWTSPFRLEDYLIPASADWRIDSKDIVYSSVVSFPVIIEDVPNFYSFLRINAGLHSKRLQYHVYSNADNSIGHYRSLFHELFKPSPLLKKATEFHLGNIGTNYWAFTFRFLQLLGDFNDWAQTTLSTDDAEHLINKVENEFKILIKDIPIGYRILVTSDSKRFLDHIAKIDSRIYVVPGEVKNIDLLKGEFKNAWLKTFVDQQLLMRAKKVFLLRTDGMYRSGFPRFAAEVGGAEFIDHKF